MVFKYGDYTQCTRCCSKNIKLVKRIFKNGAVNYQYQCLDCGNSSGSVKTDTIPKEILENCSEYDADIKTLRLAREHEEWLLKEEERICQREKEKESFFNILKNYYLSPEWRFRRLKRLEYNKKYFGGKCERCRKNDATCVHHRSYSVLNGMEHTFDLEALCEDCHKMLHPHMRND